MTSIVFVHGTGGRQKAYAETFEQMEQALHSHKIDAKLIPCLWGDPLGAKLNAGGVSIPDDREVQGGQTLTADEESIRFWESFYKDPFYEIRLLGLRPLQDEAFIPGTIPPAQKLEARVKALSESDELQATLDRLGRSSIKLRSLTGQALSRPHH